MTIAFWCVLVAGLMPLLWTGVAKLSAPRFDNRDPRGWQSRLQGLPYRAHAAHLNSFEAFPLFAASVLVAHQAGAEQTTTDALAVGFILLRLLYGLSYLADRDRLRSLVWLAALACSVGLFVIAAR